MRNLSLVQIAAIVAAYDPCVRKLEEPPAVEPPPLEPRGYVTERIPRADKRKARRDRRAKGW